MHQWLTEEIVGHRCRMGSNGVQWVPMGPRVPVGSNEVQWDAMGEFQNLSN